MNDQQCHTTEQINQNFKTIFNKKKLWYWYLLHTTWWLYCHKIVKHNLVAMFPSDNM